MSGLFLPGLVNDCKLLVTNALNGDAQAQYHIGRKYEFGFEATQNLYLAMEWYKLAAEQGNYDARLRLNELNMR